MTEPKMKNKIWTQIVSIWKDPVWSKVIASGIIFLIASIWLKINSYTLVDGFNFILDFLVYQIPVYFFLSLIAIYFLIPRLIILFKPKKDPIWDEPIGNYNFRELCQILQGQNFPVRTLGMEMTGRQAPKEDLLFLFNLYITHLNQGIKMEDHIDDGGFLFSVLAPKLLSYGLVDKLEVKHEQLDIMEDKYQTSEIGHKFYSLLQKIQYRQKK